MTTAFILSAHTQHNERKRNLFYSTWFPIPANDIRYYNFSPILHVDDANVGATMRPHHTLVHFVLQFLHYATYVNLKNSR